MIWAKSFKTDNDKCQATGTEQSAAAKMRYLVFSVPGEVAQHQWSHIISSYLRTTGYKVINWNKWIEHKKLDTYIYLYLFCSRGYWYNIISTTTYRSFADLWDMTYETTHWLVLTVQKWSLPSLSKPCKAQFPPMIASGFGMSPSCPNTMALAPSVTYAHIESREREFE